MKIKIKRANFMARCCITGCNELGDIKDVENGAALYYCAKNYYHTPNGKKIMRQSQKNYENTLKGMEARIQANKKYRENHSEQIKEYHREHHNKLKKKDRSKSKKLLNFLVKDSCIKCLKKGCVNLESNFGFCDLCINLEKICLQCDKDEKISN